MSQKSAPTGAAGGPSTASTGACSGGCSRTAVRRSHSSAREVHLTVTPTLERVRRLESAGYIEGYFAP